METQPSARELKVKASFFIPAESDVDTLASVQKHLRIYLEHQGYVQYSVDGRPFGATMGTMEFVSTIHMVNRNPSLITRFKGLLGFDVEDQNIAANARASIDKLRGIRDDVVYQYVFYFRPVKYEESEGFDVTVEATPVLLQKFRQLDLDEKYSYNLNDVVQETKDQVKKVTGNFGVTPYYGPNIEAEFVGQLLSNDEQEVLQRYDYGRTVLKFINQGDRCLEDDLLHAALSCYIHGIEWAIICYKDGIEGVDLIERQREEDDYLMYRELIDEIRRDTSVSRITIETLEKLNTAERRWIAHHREGSIPQTNVHNVRENLGRLIGELFREEVQEIQ